MKRLLLSLTLLSAVAQTANAAPTPNIVAELRAEAKERDAEVQKNKRPAGQAEAEK